MTNLPAKSPAKKPANRPERATERMPTLQVTVLNRQRRHPVDREMLRELAGEVLNALDCEADEVAICLVSDRRMRELNRDFRHKDRTTDVLSFPCDEPFPDGERHLGDLVISVEQAARQARRGLEHELLVLTIHGLLHLMGHDHERDDGTMMRLQQRLVRRFAARAAAR